ncbi:unnamed protein product [Hymenolepis diminuta]|uniref:C2H2-type domain-containing protein n=1 Tax=Hymenolepis diminuta TaxID=6216 RepID=A0A0R3SVL3_HYMDI|nr:unnamed protein product [Hymenolepis diminuta]VUZ39084.1 unnamed protein product [Hymenolepis diminuta]
MDTKCPYCGELIPDTAFHEHFSKCRKITATLRQQNDFYQPPPPDRPYYSLQSPPAYSESPPTYPPSSNQSWKCNSCNLNFDAREEFQKHLRSSEHNRALGSGSKIKDTSCGYPNPSLNLGPIGILTDQQPEAASYSPPTQPRTASEPPQTNEEIKHIVRSEMAKYLRHFLQIVEGDATGNSL